MVKHTFQFSEFHLDKIFSEGSSGEHHWESGTSEW
ncbi:hypothetical protein PVE_R1G6114 [Pseudomonas veronii 1YdBTEX2]|uniref:Uncharacterized protein n=1 Tax=Pseudomonas veronii 1YdBTEX2 TaxID=1295141 RepID=A0A1D3K6M2_PSEVE|nr:hypothetical protein PVE_R1G6114 [Pseudomonas veronii 1YdBTEX2]